MNKFNSPHIRHEDTPHSMTLDLCIALLPALIWGFYVFGLRSLVITLFSVIFFLAFEVLSRLIFKKALVFFDLSAIGSALLFAMLLPVAVPLWIIPIGAFLAVFLAKGLLGGLGKFFINPILFAKGILLLVFPKAMNLFTQPFASLSPFKISLSEKDLEPFLTSSPLALLKEEGFSISLSDLMTGSVAGNIGEVSALLSLAGLLYLLVRGVISWRIPTGFLLSAFSIALLFPAGGGALSFGVNSVLSGGLLLGAIFLATDPPSSPVTRGGQISYGILCGAFTLFFRSLGQGFQGMVFAVLLANLLSRPLDLIFRPRPYGETGRLKVLWNKISPKLQTLLEKEKEKLLPLLKKIQKKK